MDDDGDEIDVEGTGAELAGFAWRDAAAGHTHLCT
jgi:hypothetical protein